MPNTLLSQLTKKSFSSLMDSSEEDGKIFLRKGNQFEVVEQDQLNEKEKQLSHELDTGVYQIIVSSLSGKFHIELRVFNKSETLLKVGQTLSGRGKNSKFETRFEVEEPDSPVHLELSLRDKTFFWSKSSYDFKIRKIVLQDPVKAIQQQVTSQASPQTPVNQQGKKLLHVKIYDPQGECRIITISNNITWDKLKTKIEKEFRPGLVLKYIDTENEKVSITREEDLKLFFQFVNKKGTPKLSLHEPPKAHISQSAVINREKVNPEGVGPISKSFSEGMMVPQSQSPRMAPTPPTPSGKRKTVKHWELGNLLGSGAFGKVYLGLNLDDGSLMACKQIPIDMVESSLESEINLMSQLDHEHIVRYLGVERTSEFIYIFLDYIPGGSLENVIGDFQLPERVIRKYTLQILKGLKYLHENNIIHRDIKAGNILLDEFGRVYVADFGCSKKIVEGNEKKAISGTPNYMPLEVIKNGEYSPKSDIWSLGCTVLEMCTRSPPWNHVLHQFDSAYKFLYWFSVTDEKLTDSIPDSLSDNCKDFIKKCLTIDPKQRPTASDLMEHAFIAEETDDTHEVQPVEKPAPVVEAPSTEEGVSDDDEEFDDIYVDLDSDDDSDDLLESILSNQGINFAPIEEEDNDQPTQPPMPPKETSEPAPKDEKEQEQKQTPQKSLSTKLDFSSSTKQHLTSSTVSGLSPIKTTNTGAQPKQPVQFKTISNFRTTADISKRQLARTLLKRNRLKRKTSKLNLEQNQPRDVKKIEKFLQKNAMNQTSKMLNANARFSAFVRFKKNKKQHGKVLEDKKKDLKKLPVNKSL